jgi:hypothetical protein
MSSPSEFDALPNIIAVSSKQVKPKLPGSRRFRPKRAGPAVRIHLAPPCSPSVFGRLAESIDDFLSPKPPSIRRLLAHSRDRDWREKPGFEPVDRVNIESL